MSVSKAIDSLKQSVLTFPEQTQVAIAIVRKKAVEYYGFINRNGGSEEIDNRLFAFEIGSVTKAFTGYVLAQLVNEKKVTLDDLAQAYLPFPLLNEPPITLGQLAMHTSGLQRMPHDFETSHNYDEKDPFVNYTEEHLAEYFSHNLRMDSAPGEKYQYSNLGSGLLSYIIARVEGKPFAEVVAERIFRPLKMLHSSFSVHDLKTTIVKGIDDKGSFCEHWDGGILNGCVGIIATVEDMARFTIAICDPENAIANLQSEEYFVVDEAVKTNLGWSERLILPENIRMQGINGGTGGYGASVLVNREFQCGVVLLSNCWPWHYLDRIYPLGKQLLIELSKEIEE
ncbi:MAG: serine hydrolase domain-containing protein [Chitinophagaceae bacterium]